MAYVPKSKISYRTSFADEFIFKKSTRPYNGPYITIEDKKYYVGTDFLKKGPELIKLPKHNPAGVEKRFNTHIDIRNYNRLKTSIKSRLSKSTTLPVSKSYPTEFNYERGYYTRYFAKKFNGYSYLEISPETYKKLLDKSPIHDYNLWETGTLQWHLTGNVFKKNSLSINEAERKFPRVFNLFPIINEFFRPETTIISNLHTDGGELYYSDGVEYIGGYHIHPIIGPMIGSDHSENHHQKIYYLNQLPTPTGSTYEDFIINHGKIDCYKCVTIKGVKKIVSHKRSNILGCPPNSTNSYDIAVEGCYIRGVDHERNSFSNNSLSPRIKAPSFPIEGGNPSKLDYSGFGSWGPSGGTCFTPNTLITMIDNTEKMISKIEIGDKVKSELGESTVTDIKIHTGSFTIFSLNGNKPFVTEEHPFKTIDGWKAINPITTLEKHQVQSTTLDINDIVIKTGGNEIIKSIEEGKVKYPKVYNLSLDNEHVYYANGYLVHNEKHVGVEIGAPNITYVNA
tara:strand:+ start:1600 stop:3129 length:1530 start_codon:yes stop_codon:yes gene_type:complete